MKLTQTIEDEYKDVEGKDILQPNNANSKHLSKISEAYCFLLKEYEEFQRNPNKLEMSIKKFHDNLINKLYFYAGDYTREDILAFNFSLLDFQSESNFSITGLFLSALVNKHYQQHFNDITDTKTPYFLRTDIFSKRIDYVGCFLNGAHLIIEGSVHHDAGFCMQQGKLEINGNTYNYCGNNMMGGLLVVNGNTSSHLGREMINGIIHITKNTDSSAGFQMWNGSIFIDGHCGSKAGAKMSGGTIVCSSTENFAGTEMRGGTLLIRGDAGYLCGYSIRGGTIIIEGNSGMSLGNKMYGGKIISYKSAKEMVGQSMYGGEIYLLNDIDPEEKIARNYCHGKIYNQKYELVQKK